MQRHATTAQRLKSQSLQYQGLHQIHQRQPAPHHPLVSIPSISGITSDAWAVDTLLQHDPSQSLQYQGLHQMFAKERVWEWVKVSIPSISGITSDESTRHSAPGRISLNPFNIRDYIRSKIKKELTPAQMSQSLQYQGLHQILGSFKIAQNIGSQSLQYQGLHQMESAIEMLWRYVVSIPSISGITSDKSIKRSLTALSCLNPFNIRDYIRCINFGLQVERDASQSLQYQGLHQINQG